MALFERSKAQLLRRAEQALQASRPITAEQLEARACSLEQFVRWAWGIVDPAPCIWNWHMSAICEHLQALVEDKLAANNLLITVPPGSAKSRLVSVMLIAWQWARHPPWRVIAASGNPRVSTRDSLLTRQLIGSPQYRNKFGIAWDISDSQDQKTLFNNTAGGFRMATTSGSRVTGDRADALLIDDPLDAADAYSQAARDAVITWYSQAFANRLNDLRTGKRVIICQRLHPEDLAGYVLGVERSEWEHLTIPMEFEAKRAYTSSIGWTDPRTQDGELMFAERYPRAIVEQEKVRLGNSGAAGQLQQRPSIAGGEIFKRAHLQLLTEVPACTQTIITVDSAFKTGEENDYSVALVLGQFERGVVILDCIRGKYQYPQLKALIIELADRVRPAAVLVEDKASGQSLIQDLQQTTALPVKAVPTDGDKLMRANVIVPTWDAHRVHALANAPWLADFLDEITVFPKAPHDDQVDAFVQGVRHLGNNTGASGYLAWLANDLARMTASKETPAVLTVDKASAPQKPRSLVDTPGAVVTEITPWH
jgi:predicted phage terminase large subunit-like protein